MFRNRATVLTSNDPAALPPKDPMNGAPIVLVPTAISATPIQPVSPLPVLVEPKPSEGAFAGFKRLWGGFQDPQPEESAPTVAAPTTPMLTAPISNSSPTPNTIPASGNMEGVRPYEPPNLLNSFQQLFN